MAKFGSTPQNDAMNPVLRERQEQVHRLSRLAGQIGGIARMIEEDRSATDILTQIKAVRSALNAVEERVVQKALQTGIDRALERADKQAVREELIRLFGLQAEASRIRRETRSSSHSSDHSADHSSGTF